MPVDLKSRFIEFYHNELSQHHIWKLMEETVEDSPWHREDNVAIHTNMVVSEYIARSPEQWGDVDVVGAVACAFHDFGKPSSLEERYSEERGHYKRFAGHEKVSARIFESWAVENFDRLEYLGLSARDIHKIAWLCEHHLPWGIKKPLKREALARTALYIDAGTDACILERCLLSDTWGRISDDADTKRANALAWVAEFQEFKASLEPLDQTYDPDQPVLWVAIGAPGCGKSTFRKQLTDDTLIHNMDELRVKWYIGKDASEATDDEYDAAYKRSTEDKEFASRVHQTFLAMVKTGQDVYCDNTNASNKRRAFYVNEARRRGYNVQAVLFLSSLPECIRRQKTRPDKSVPPFAVERIYEAIQQPQIGEFDNVYIVDSNIV